MIPLPILNTLHAFALRHGYNPQNMEYHLPNDAQIGISDNALQAKRKRLGQSLFHARGNQLRWFPITSYIKQVEQSLTLSFKRNEPSILLFVQRSAHHLSYDEVTEERLESLLSLKCPICLDSIGIKVQRINCERCQTPICFMSCLSQQIQVVEKSWKGEATKDTLRHFACPICRHLSMEDLRRIHSYICIWEGIDFEEDEMRSLAVIKDLKKLYIKYQDQT